MIKTISKLLLADNTNVKLDKNIKSEIILKSFDVFLHSDVGSYNIREKIRRYVFSELRTDIPATKISVFDISD